MSSGVFNKFKQFLVDGTTNGQVDFDADTIKVALVTSSFSPDFDTMDYFDDVTNEVSGTGYSAGGATLGSVTITLDTANDRVDIDAADVTWTTSTITARGAVLYNSTGTASTSPLIAYYDFGSDKVSSAGDFTIQWAAAGLLRVS